MLFNVSAILTIISGMVLLIK